MSTKKTTTRSRKAKALKTPKKKSNGIDATPATNVHAQKVQHHIVSMAQRLGRQIARMKAYALPDTKIVGAASTAFESMTETIKLLAEVPEDWRPLRGSITTAALEPGTKVSIKDKYLAKYDGAIDKGAEITIHGLAGRQLKLVTLCEKERTMMLVPRSHVQAAQA